MKLFKKAVDRPIAAVSTRIVAQKRWLHKNQLEVGMYVEELDKPWSETSFMFQGFRIDSFEMLRQVQDACEYASVQTEKLARIPTGSSSRLISAVK